jgi:hypothetical protein
LKVAVGTSGVNEMALLDLLTEYVGTNPAAARYVEQRRAA